MTDQPPQNGTRYVSWKAYHDDQSQRDREVDSRLRKVESVIDQQRGARTLIYFLIGSNLTVIVGLGLVALGLALR